jgi:hypothetical protein
MFPSDSTSIEPCWQRLALIAVANVVMLRDSPELLRGPCPAQLTLAFSSACFPSTLFFFLILLPCILPVAASQVLKSSVSDGVGA